MRFTSYLTSAVLGMATIACAMPAGLLDPAPGAADLAKRDAAGTDWEAALVARSTDGASTIGARGFDDDAQTLEKRAGRVKVIDVTGGIGKKGGKMSEPEKEIWYPLATKVASDAGVDRVTIVHRPHSGRETSSADDSMHISVIIPGKKGMIHVWEDGTSTLSVKAGPKTIQPNRLKNQPGGPGQRGNKSSQQKNKQNRLNSEDLLNNEVPLKKNQQGPKKNRQGRLNN
ncbi:hypothetical protein PspLS_09288 [Pyricularia sp. CBS 133598]|nr:hypothetical protein PspLS_09288 [Pyricularia sp. CBS 133598]